MKVTQPLLARVQFSTTPIGDVIRDTETIKEIAASLPDKAKFFHGGYSVDKEQLLRCVGHPLFLENSYFLLKTGEDTFEVVAGYGRCGSNPLIGDPLPVKLAGEQEFHSDFGMSGTIGEPPKKLQSQVQ